MIASDQGKLENAQQSIGLAQQAVSTLYNAEDSLLAEHVFELLEPFAKMNQKLQRMLTVTKLG
jgi:hypothetical protein